MKSNTCNILECKTKDLILNIFGMSNIFPIDFEEKLTMAQDDYILFSDSEDGNKIKKAQYKNLK